MPFQPIDLRSQQLLITLHGAQGVGALPWGLRAPAGREADARRRRRRLRLHFGAFAPPLEAAEGRPQ